VAGQQAAVLEGFQAGPGPGGGRGALVRRAKHDLPPNKRGRAKWVACESPSRGATGETRAYGLGRVVRGPAFRAGGHPGDRGGPGNRRVTSPILPGTARPNEKSARRAVLVARGGGVFRAGAALVNTAPWMSDQVTPAWYPSRQCRSHLPQSEPV